MVPMQFVRAWKWENIWLVFATCAYLILPWVFATLTIPSLVHVYTGTNLHGAVMIVLFGIGWGVAAIMFDLACDTLGMALGFTLILGLGTVSGSMIPLLFLDRARFFSAEGLHIVWGVLVMIAGTSICAWAGKLRDDGVRVPADHPPLHSHSFFAGLVFALVSGLLDPLVNFALVFGSNLTTTAVALHQHWRYNNPYAAWRWSAEDWKRASDMAAYLRVNLVMLWPHMSMTGQVCGTYETKEERAMDTP
jgi:L-rhamnose-H+ transport protein